LADPDPHHRGNRLAGQHSRPARTDRPPRAHRRGRGWRHLVGGDAAGRIDDAEPAQLPGPHRLRGARPARPGKPRGGTHQRPGGP
nr:hypothetical protein [Tanacetum cinerariifolium]